MVKETQLDTITGMIASIIAGSPDIFLVEVKIKPTNNVKVFLDGDSGISIQRCAEVNRSLYKRLEETNLFPGGDFSLEVSSPGLDEPLKLQRQYQKNIGRNVETTTIEGAKIEGRLTKADQEQITIEEEKGKNKKKEIVVHTIPVNNIKSTKIQIKF
jgi:ribosome maturation factor RimP